MKYYINTMNYMKTIYIYIYIYIDSFIHSFIHFIIFI